MKKLFLAAVLALAAPMQSSADSVGPASVQIDATSVGWVRTGPPQFPPGLTLRFLGKDAYGGPGIGIVKFPKGYLEPRHYHTTNGHTSFILKGQLNSGGRLVGPGSFIYFPAGTAHGPNAAIEETELLRWADGPLDLHLGAPEKPGAPIIFVDTEALKWRGVKSPGFPEGLMAAYVFETPVHGSTVTLLKFPKGFTAPAQRHTEGGHSSYILQGKMRLGALTVGPGHYSYVPTNMTHGPDTALEETLMLIWSDAKSGTVVE